MYTYRAPDIDEANRWAKNMVICGERQGYQVQIQDSMNTNIRLLHDKPDPACAPDEELAALAKKVNHMFEGEAKRLLAAKRAKQGKNAERIEVTVLLTDKGLQLAYAYGLEKKQVAPTPRKSMARRLLGPLAVNRRYWSMPKHHTDPAPITTVQWPWLVWLVLIIGAAAFSFMSLTQ